VVARQCSAIEVDRKVPAELQPAPFHEGPAFTDLAEAEAFQSRKHGDREGVVQHAEVDVVYADTRLGKRPWPRLLGANVDDRPPSPFAMSQGLTTA